MNFYSPEKKKTDGRGSYNTNHWTKPISESEEDSLLGEYSSISIKKMQELHKEQLKNGNIFSPEESKEGFSSDNGSVKETPEIDLD